MAIEFPCIGCGKQLSVPADAAGKRARCPQCETILDVPSSVSDSFPSPDEDLYRVGPEESSAEQVSGFGGLSSSSEDAGFKTGPISKPGGYDDNPYASPTMGYDEPKPGHFSNKTKPHPLEFEAAFSRTWRIFKSQMGIVIGAVLIVAGVNIGLNFVSGIIEEVLRNDDSGPLVVFGFDVMSWLVNTFLGIGETIVLLRVARGQPADLGEILGGGPYFMRVLGGSILFGLMVLLGLLLLIIPGIVLALMFGQYYVAIIDRDAGLMDAFRISREITDGNKLTLLGISIVGGLLALGVALITCGVGLLIIGPYLALMTPVVYLMMAGEPIAQG